MLNVRRDFTKKLLEELFKTYEYPTEEISVKTATVEDKFYRRAVDSDEYYYLIFNFIITNYFNNLKELNKPIIIEYLKEFSEKIITDYNQYLNKVEIKALINKMFDQIINNVRNLQELKHEIIKKISSVASVHKTVAPLKEIAQEFVMNNINIKEFSKTTLPFCLESTVKKRKFEVNFFPNEFKR